MNLPGKPDSPWIPRGPMSPFSPTGPLIKIDKNKWWMIIKLKLETVIKLPGGPSGPLLPGIPVSPFGPWNILDKNCIRPKNHDYQHWTEEKEKISKTEPSNICSISSISSSWPMSLPGLPVAPGLPILRVLFKNQFNIFKHHTTDTWRPGFSFWKNKYSRFYDCFTYFI